MARILALVIGLLPVLAFGGDHWLLSFPPTSVTATSTAVVVTSPAETKGIIKGVIVAAAKAPTAVSEVVLTTTVLGTKNGQSRTLASVVSTSAVPNVVSVTIPVFGEIVSVSITSTGTNAHNLVHTVIPTILYER